ncbi:uncharacterized protein BYT42DRAFT_616529 [Radiomyces spectabilis]|uniref:uncharacterized protein n=1 Tax=Radiomyces spectabilis TaxID=64574 RepID=UPI0022203B32|nr:uncharacterized protein BYT42DRAFT_616529 [Radiomyces spectabilis]KAI8371438.1 hypothetical protein BYT42DRAFT_616529 [Radiomyces spectabilis]
MFKRSRSPTSHAPKQPSSAKKSKKSPSTSKDPLLPWQIAFRSGATAFSERNYNEALRCFNQALELQPNEAIILDSRSATHEKLQCPEAALKDAVHTCRVARQDSRGYLRAGKLLSLQGKWEEAFRVYNKGAKHVLSSDPRYPTIIQMKLAVKCKLNARDFVSVFPYEILDNIFSRLSFRRRLQCSAVSKSWRHFMIHWAPMWKHFDFGSDKPSLAVISRYLSYANPRCISSFHVENYSKKHSDKLLQMLIDNNCQYLQRLEMALCQLSPILLYRTLRLIGNHITHLQLDYCSTDADTLLQLIQGTPSTLTHLSILGRDLLSSPSLVFPSKLMLRSLSVTVEKPGDVLTAANFQRFIAACPVLEQVYIDYVSHNASMPLLALKSHCPHLQTIEISSVTRSTKAFDDIQLQQPAFAPGLRAFISNCLSDTPDEDIQRTLNDQYESLEILKMPKLSPRTALPIYLSNIAWCRLREVSFKACSAFQANHLCSFLEKAPSIEILDLACVWNTDDRVLQVVSQLKDLQKMDISFTSVTGIGVRLLVDERGPNLKKLTMNGCHSVGADVVAYARDRLGRSAVECMFN